LLDAAGIPRASETTITAPADIENMSPPGFPIAMKVVGPVHKTDVGGVMLNINSMQELKSGFERLMQIDNAEAVLVQPMIDGVELFAGVKRESNFGHLIVCGLGGIFIEILNDFSSGLAPLTKAESLDMIRSLQGYKVFQGVRGREGVNEELFSEIIQRLSLLVEIAPEIVEMDMNPLMGEANSVVAVDTRVRVLRQSEN
jgi:acetyltransferase